MFSVTVRAGQIPKSDAMRLFVFVYIEISKTKWKIHSQSMVCSLSQYTVSWHNQRIIFNFINCFVFGTIVYIYRFSNVYKCTIAEKWTDCLVVRQLWNENLVAHKLHMKRKTKRFIFVFHFQYLINI